MEACNNVTKPEQQNITLCNGMAEPDLEWQNIIKDIDEVNMLTSAP